MGGRGKPRGEPRGTVVVWGWMGAVMTARGWMEGRPERGEGGWRGGQNGVRVMERPEDPERAT